MFHMHALTITDRLVRLEQGPWTDEDVERQLALFLASGTSHQSNTKDKTCFFAIRVPYMHLRIPSAQLVRTLQYVGNIKDDVLACFTLILDEDRARKQRSKQRNNGWL